MPTQNGQRFGRWKTIDILQHLFSRYGISQQIVSDNGLQFRSEEFEGFTKSRHYKSAVYHAATNGAVECFLKTLKQTLRLNSWWVPPLKKYFVTSYFSIRLPSPFGNCTVKNKE